MHHNELSIQELGSSKILVYKGDVENLNFHANLPNILTFVRTTFVDVPLCYFDVTGKAPFSEVQKYTLDKYDLLKILKTSATVANSCAKSNISLSTILFDTNYVFVDSDFNAYFIPLKTEDTGDVDLHTFLKNLVVDSVIDSRYTDNFVQLLINCFNDPHFTLDGLLELVDQMLASKPYNLSEDLSNIVSSKEKSEPGIGIDKNMTSEPSSYTDTIIADMLKRELNNAKNQNKEPSQGGAKTPLNSGFAPNIGHSYIEEPEIATEPEPQLPPLQQQPPMEQAPPPQQQTPSPAPQPEEMRPDRYMGDYGQEFQQRGEAAEHPGQAYLIDSEDPNTRIPINYNPFRVGRNPDLVDFVINSPYVGRLHAVVLENEGAHFVVDKNSTNGTFLNNQHLQPEQQAALKNGDVIRFAKHSYQFVIS